MTQTASPRFLDIGGLVLDRERSCLLRDGEAVRLEPRIADLLAYLAGAGGRIVSREELIREVWQAHVVDDAVHRAMSLLRGALGDDPRTPRLIETVPGRGYRLLTEAGPIAPPPHIPATQRIAVPAALGGLAAGVILTLLVGSLTEEKVAYAPEAPTPSPTAQPATPVYAPEAPRP